MPEAPRHDVQACWLPGCARGRALPALAAAPAAGGVRAVAQLHGKPENRASAKRSHATQSVTEEKVTLITELVG